MHSLYLAEATGAGDHFVTWGIALITLAASIAIRVAWASRRGNNDLKTILARTIPAAWILPALAIVIAVAVQAGPALNTRHPAPNGPDTHEVNAKLVVKGHDWTARSLVEKDQSGRPITHTPISSKPHSTKQQARQEALDLAGQRLKYEVERVYGRAGEWELPGELLKGRPFITKEITTTLPYNLSSLAPSSNMYHCVVRLEISDDSLQWAAEYWKQSVGIERLKTVGTIAGLLCLLVITAHVYLRLDLASAGTHRGKLQLAAVAAIAAAGLVASTFLST